MAGQDGGFDGCWWLIEADAVVKWWWSDDLGVVVCGFVSFCFSFVDGGEWVV